MDVSCLAPCTVNEAIPLEPWVPPVPPSGESVTTANSASVVFSGTGTADDPLTAEVQGDIEFEIGMARTGAITPSEYVFGYSTARGFTLPQDQSVASCTAINLSGPFFLALVKADANQATAVVGSMTVDVDGSIEVTLNADTVFSPDESLLYGAQIDTNVTFDILTITLVGHRPIRFV